jgi:SAM-dependent methyltransferase
MTCPIGCSGHVEPLFEKLGIPYFRCSVCGFVFSKPAVNANFANDIADYEPAYLQYFADSLEDQWNHTAVMRWVERIHPVAGRRVLDIGSGSGKFVRYLRRAGADAYGLEPASPLFERYLAGEPFFIPRTVEEFAASTDTDPFDLIFACDVIEHVERPDHFLRDTATMLRPGGVLFVSTPDVGSLFARVCGRRWHFYNRYHLSYLSPTTIRALAARSGLREVGCAYLPRMKSVGFVLSYFANFVLGMERANFGKRLEGVAVPLNLYDTMSIAFEKS